MNNIKSVLITGGTGLIGKALSKILLEKGYHVIVLTRKIPADNAKLSFADKKYSPSVEYALWNVQQQSIDSNAISKADFIIHLAGAGIADKRWTKKRKEEIVSSRIKSSRLIANSLLTIPNHVKAVVSASATGWYGPDPATSNHLPFTEKDNFASDFLGKTCQLWEESIKPVTANDKRLVILRTGIVLTRKGGALKEFLKPFRFGIAAILGSGKQVVSWIHINDLVNIYISAIENEQMNGVYNAVAPLPVSNKHLVLALAKTSKGFHIPVHIPKFILRMVMGEMSAEVLKSTTVSADKIQQAGFKFSYPAIEVALANLAQ